MNPDDLDALLELAIYPEDLTPEARTKLERIPRPLLREFTTWFKPGKTWQVLNRFAPSRGGIDAWTWVENGHSWIELGEGYRRIFESETLA